MSTESEDKEIAALLAGSYSYRILSLAASCVQKMLQDEVDNAVRAEFRTVLSTFIPEPFVDSVEHECWTSTEWGLNRGTYRIFAHEKSRVIFPAVRSSDKTVWLFVPGETPLEFTFRAYERTSRYSERNPFDERDVKASATFCRTKEDWPDLRMTKKPFLRKAGHWLWGHHDVELALEGWQARATPRGPWRTVQQLCHFNARQYSIRDWRFVETT